MNWTQIKKCKTSFCIQTKIQGGIQACAKTTTGSHTSTMSGKIHVAGKPDRYV